MLEPTDKVSFGLMSELPGCNMIQMSSLLLTFSSWEQEAGRGLYLDQPRTARSRKPAFSARSKPAAGRLTNSYTICIL